MLDNSVKCAANEEQWNMNIKEKDHHLKLAENAYREKKIDIDNSKKTDKEKVLVFDIQQNLPTPPLSTNTVYYKRQLWTYNLTVRKCTDSTTTCFMWHEALSDRGANQVASCLIKCLESLPENVTKVTLYSDSFRQNKNNTVAAALSWFIYNSSHIREIEHKFLEVGHTRLECDADHAKIERAKKHSSIEIRIPQDWYQFVRTVRGKSNFKVVEMQKEDMLSYSSLF